jgi:hypothetical protein
VASLSGSRIVQSMEEASRHPDIAPDEPAVGGAAADLLRAMAFATFKKNKDERKRCGDELDAIEWAEASILLAAAKEVALLRHKNDIDEIGVDAWVEATAKALVAHHSDWMRLQAAQVAAMLRSGLGKRGLALSVPKPTRGRFDITIVSYLIQTKMQLRDEFSSEFDDVLIDADQLRTRRSFAEDFEGQ